MNQVNLESNFILQDIQKILHFLNNFETFDHRNDSIKVSTPIDAITFRLKNKDLSQSKNVKRKKSIFSNIRDFMNEGIEVLDTVSTVMKDFRIELKEISLENAIDNLNEFYNKKLQHNESIKKKLQELGNSASDEIMKKLLSRSYEEAEKDFLINEMKKDTTIKKDSEYLNLYNEFQILKKEYDKKYCELQTILDKKIIPFFEKFVLYFNDSNFEKSTLELVLNIENRLNNNEYIFENFSMVFEIYDYKLPQKKDLIELTTNIKNQMGFLEADNENNLLSDILKLNDLDDYFLERKALLYEIFGLQKEINLIQYYDSELDVLKLELKNLEIKFQELIEEKTEYLNNIEEFNIQYNLHLGDLIKTILNLRKEILYKKTIKQQKEKEKYQEDIQTFQDTKENIDELKSTISELEDVLESIDKDDENYEELSEAYNELKEELEKLEDELELQEKELEKTKEFIEDETIEQEYEEVNSHYQEFESEYENIKEAFENSITLNDEEKKELKLLYKKAARLCHPDIVPDELKEKAHNLMQKLNDAYSKKDISKVKEILHSLKNGTSFEVSSDTIDNSELLKEKIKEYKQSIKDIEKEIEEIKEDVTYQAILEIDDWDEYFKNLKDELQNEKNKLEEENSRILENTKENNEAERVEIIHKCPAFESEYYDELSLFIENWIIQKLSMQGIDVHINIMTQTRVKESSKQVANELILNKVSNIRLPFLITNNGKIENFFIDNITFETFQEINNVDQTQNQVKKTIIVEPEISQYSNYIRTIKNPNFEKIRRYCNNLLNNNKSDEMQKYLAENGKMYKAIIYDALEQFISKLDKKTITLVDLGCEQGIGSMLVLDYIKEKQLDIVVNQIILLDDNTTAISRAMPQIEALKQNDIEIITVRSNDISEQEKLKNIKNEIILNLIVNDKFPVDYKLFKNSYFMCVSNSNKNFVDEIYENISDFGSVENLSIRDSKIGRFDRYEKIFKINNYEQNIFEIDIDEDKLPF